MITVTIESTHQGEGKTTLANDIKHVMEQEGNRVFLEDEVDEHGIPGGRSAPLGFREETRRQGKLAAADVHIIVKMSKGDVVREGLRRNYNDHERDLIAKGREAEAKNLWHARRPSRV